MRIGVRSRRQQRRRVHPADEGQGGRALPRRRRLPETRARAGQRQADRDRRLRSGRSHRRLLPAHLRSRGRDPRGAGAGRRNAALRHSGLSPAARPARPGARRDPGARNHDPHQRRGREPRRFPQELRRRVPRPRHPALASDPDRRRPSVLRARRHRFPARRAQRRAGAGRAAGDRRRRRQRRDRRRLDGPAPGRNARRHGLAREPPRDAGQRARDRERRRGRRAAAPGLGPGPDRGGRREPPSSSASRSTTSRESSIRSSTPPAC